MKTPILVCRVGRPLTSGGRAYVFRIVPLKSCSDPREGDCRYFEAGVVDKVLVGRQSFGGPPKVERVGAGTLGSNGWRQGMEGAGTPPPSVPWLSRPPPSGGRVVA